MDHKDDNPHRHGLTQAPDPDSGSTASSPGVGSEMRCMCDKPKHGPGCAPAQAQIADLDRSVLQDVEINGSESGQDLDEKMPSVDGGRRAWLVVLGAWCASFCSYGWINSSGTLQEYYEREPLREYSSSVIAWIPALQIFFISGLGPIVGRIFDSYGPRYLLLVGSVLHVAGLMAASASTEYYQFILSQGLCSGIGVASVFLSAIGCVSGWFDKRRGVAFGLLATGSSLGGVLFPIMLSRLIERVGYGWAMRAVAILIAAVLVIANLTVRCRIQPTHTKVTRAIMAKPFREVTSVVLYIGLAFVPFGLYTPINFLPTVSVKSGIDQLMAQNLVALYNAASLFGRLSSGFLADRFGRFNVFIIACYTAGILIVAVWIPGVNTAGTVAFAVFFGIFSGAYISLMPALVAQISPLEEIGYRNGVSQLATSIGGLGAAPIAGAILQLPDGILGLKLFAGAFMLAGTSVIVGSRISKTGLKFKVIF